MNKDNYVIKQAERKYRRYFRKREFCQVMPTSTILKMEIFLLEETQKRKEN